MPRFSVVVPAYNAERTLTDTLEAVRVQEFQDWECVVVDDGSTDCTAAIANSFAERDSRFRCVSQENRGVAGAYRAGIAAASAMLLAICSADDLLLPRHLAVMDDLVSRNPACSIFSCNGEYLNDQTGQRTTVYLSSAWQVERSLDFEEVVAACFFSVGAVFRREVYESVDGHRAGVYVEDYDLWLRAIARGATHRYTPEVLAVHRVSSFQRSADVQRILQSNIEVYQYLMDSGIAPPKHHEAIRATIRRGHELVRIALVDEELERQAQALRRTVEATLPSTLVEPALRVIHLISWVTRPFRRARARRTAT